MEYSVCNKLTPSDILSAFPFSHALCFTCGDIQPLHTDICMIFLYTLFSSTNLLILLPMTGYQIVYFEMRGLISILYLYFSIHCDEQPRNHCAVHCQQHILVMLCLLYFCKQLQNIWHHYLQRLHTVLVW